MDLNLFKRFEIENGFLTPQLERSLQTQFNIFNEYNPHLLLFLQDDNLDRLTRSDNNLRFKDRINLIGQDRISKDLQQYSLKDLEKAYSFFTALQTGVYPKAHKELFTGLNLDLYDFLIKYYFAVAFDSYANMGNSTGTSLNYSITTAGSNRMLYTTINTGTGALDIIAQVAYATIPMTLVNKLASSDLSTYTYLYYLISPATGANNVVITTNNGAVGVRSASASYTGAKQTGQPDNSTINTATGTSITTSLTPNADNCWIVSGVGQEGGANAAGTGTTLRDSGSTSSIGDTNGAITPAASTSMQWTTGSSLHFATIMASMAPVLSTFYPRKILSQAVQRAANY